MLGTLKTSCVLCSGLESKTSRISNLGISILIICNSLLANNGIRLLLSLSCNKCVLNFTDERQPLEYLKNGDWIRLEHVAYVHFFKKRIYV